MALPLAARCRRMGEAALTRMRPEARNVLEPLLGPLEEVVEALTPAVLAPLAGGLMAHHGTVLPTTATVIVLVTPALSAAVAVDLARMPRPPAELRKRLAEPRALIKTIAFLARSEGREVVPEMLELMGTALHEGSQDRRLLEEARGVGRVPIFVTLIAWGDGKTTGMRFAVPGRNLDPALLEGSAEPGRPA
jgi:hypothetical protein